MERRSPMPRKPMLAVLLLAATVLAACSSPANLTTAVPTPEFEAARQIVPAIDPFIRGGGELQPEVPRIWFVETDARPVAGGGAIGTANASVDAVQAAAAEAGIELAPRYSFNTFVSGFSAEVEASDLLALAALPGVRRVMPVGLVDAPMVVDHGATPDVSNARDLTGASYVNEDLLYTGAGVKVGIIDSGILLTHPEFAGRIGNGFDFVGDRYDASVPGLDTPRPEDVYVDDPEWPNRPGGGDCGGHGTHVAGIVGAAGDVVTGVAPGVTLGAYRVFGCDGSSHSDVILAAIERAFQDGMDVVNLSLGSNNGWPQDFLAEALGRMLDFGMVPVASAGNNGANGVYTIGSPGAGDDVITVASFDNSVLSQPLMEVGPLDVPFGVLSGAPGVPVSGTTEEIVYVGQGCISDPYLDDPAGKVALIVRGACAFSQKYERAFAEGATGVVIMNNQPGNFSGSLGGTYDDGFGISVSEEDGLAIRALIDEPAAPTITWTDRLATDPVDTEGLISTFSSYGLAPDLSLKPDLGAPGGLIYSTYIYGAAPGVPGSSGYTTLSGTSMSSPHVAGAVALFLEARPTIDRHRVRDVLQNTAVPADFSLLPGTGELLDSVHRQGAGMLRIDRAIETRTYAVPAKLSLGESADGPFVGTLTLHNDTDVDVTYGLSQIEASGLYPVATAGDSYEPDFYTSAPQVEYFALRQSGLYDPIDEITVPAGGLATFQVRVTADATVPDTTVYGTYLVFTPQVVGPLNGPLPAQTILVPAAGFKGDYQDLPAYWLPPTTAGIYGGSLFTLPEDWVFTMRDGDVPGFIFGLSHGVERAFAEIVPQGERTWIGPQPGFEVDLLRKNNTGFVNLFGFGDLDATALPNGSYTIRFSALKAGGDPANPAHLEVYETDTFVIDRFAFLD